MPADEGDDRTEGSSFFLLDEIQSNLYKLLSLFYSGIGIIQRDAPGEDSTADTDELLRLENNIKEIIGQFITTKEKLFEQIDALEKEKETFPSLDSLLQKTRELDRKLTKKISTIKKELPLFQDHLNELVEEISKI